MHKKITIGFIVQDYVTIGDKHICTNQEFVAGDQVDYEDDNGEPIKIDTTKEQYQSFDMKNPPVIIGKDGLIFTCPDCEKHRLESCEEGQHSSEIINIGDEGDFDYGEINAGDGEVNRVQCLDCGFVLCKEDNSSINDNIEIVEWIKKNCEQPVPYIGHRGIDDNADK